MINAFNGKYFFLSNFFPCHINYEGIIYPSTEHAFQAAKTLDIGKRRTISVLKTAREAKAYGRKIPLRTDWEGSKVHIIYKLCHLKFIQSELKQQLLSTGKEQLIEGNTWGDAFWGVCNGKGKNYLGKILMHIRGRLKIMEEA